jgi:hypothetical protein
MEPLVILPLGLCGGLILALVLASDRLKHPSTVVVPRRLAAPSPSLINMAHIPVEGVGGLGMVAAVAVVAILDPQIRLATLMSFLLGAAFAFTLIALRRRETPNRAGGDDDDGSTLHLDGERRRKYLASIARINPTVFLRRMTVR